MMALNNTKSRDISIDILRSFAIVGIIIAHIEPPIPLVQLRSFDVVLMVFLSAVCVKGFKNDFKYSVFLAKRCTRLIFPIWIFFVVYYIGIYLFYYLPPTNEIIASFTLTSERYVWIIRILVILALISPIIYKTTQGLPSKNIILILLIGFILCELIFNVHQGKIYNMFVMTIPYALVYILGMNIHKFTKKQCLGIGIFCFITFAFLFIYHKVDTGIFKLVSEAKYPPHFYYTSYGLAVTLFMWTYRNKIQQFICKIRLKRFATFVGSHTYWLYLWHIPMIDIVHGQFSPAIRFTIVFCSSLLIVAFQDTLIRRYVKNKILISIFNG